MMTEDSSAQRHAVPITPDSKPAGAEVLRFTSERRGFFEIVGRVAAEDLVCTVGGDGCGQNTMVVLRAPQFGLNLPGEALVAEIKHCPVCGASDDGMPQLVEPTAEELAWGWAPGTVG